MSATKCSSGAVASTIGMLSACVRMVPVAQNALAGSSAGLFHFPWEGEVAAGPIGIWGEWIDDRAFCITALPAPSIRCPWPSQLPVGERTGAQFARNPDSGGTALPPPLFALGVARSESAWRRIS